MCHPEVPAGQATPEVTREEVGVPLTSGEQMPALLARPEGGRGPGILIINDVYGRSPFYESLAARLATAGFTALLPEFFFRLDPLPERSRELAMARRIHLDEGQALRELATALDWFKQQPGVEGDRLGTIGFCMGGTFVLDLAAERDDLVSVCYYGFPAGANRKDGKGPPAPLDLVDTMRGPILGFWGDQDVGVGMENVEKLAQELKRRNVDFEYTIYPGLGHGFLAASELDPEKEAYEAACESWTKTIEFYRQHLGARTAAGVS